MGPGRSIRVSLSPPPSAMEEQIEADWKRARAAELEEAAVLARMAEAARTLLECMGEDPARDGLLDTPMRMAKALRFFTRGYRQSLDEVVGGALFEADPSCDGMVIMKDIELW